MSNAKPRRGRPVGTGIDDSERLREVARLVAVNPSLKPTTAIRQLGVTDPSAVRRLRDKFHEITGGTASEAPAVREKNSAGRGSAGDGEAPAKAIALMTSRSPRKTSRPAAPAAKGEVAKEAKAKAHVTKENGRGGKAGSSVARKGDDVAAEGAARIEPVSAVAAEPPKVEAAAPVVQAKPSVANAAPAASPPPQSHPAAPAPAAPALDAGVPPISQEALTLAPWLGIGIKLMATAMEAQVALMQQMMRLPHVAFTVRQQVALSEAAVAVGLPKDKPEGEE